MQADGAAFVAAAVRAAVLAKAPRRTVQAVAAAVAGVFVRPVVAKAARGQAAPVSQDAQCTSAQPPGDASAEVLLEALRAARSAQRRRKKERRKANSGAVRPTEAVRNRNVKLEEFLFIDPKGSAINGDTNAEDFGWLAGSAVTTKAELQDPMIDSQLATSVSASELVIAPQPNCSTSAITEAAPSSSSVDMPAAGAPVFANAQAASPAVPQEKVLVQVIARSVDGEVPLDVIMKLDTVFDKMMKHWCQHNSIPDEAVKFIHQGKTLRPDDTPSSCGWSSSRGTMIINAQPTDK